MAFFSALLTNGLTAQEWVKDSDQFLDQRGEIRIGDELIQLNGVGNSSASTPPALVLPSGSEGGNSSFSEAIYMDGGYWLVKEESLGTWMTIDAGVFNTYFSYAPEDEYELSLMNKKIDSTSVRESYTVEVIGGQFGWHDAGNKNHAYVSIGGYTDSESNNNEAYARVDIRNISPAISFIGGSASVRTRQTYDVLPPSPPHNSHVNANASVAVRVEATSDILQGDGKTCSDNFYRTGSFVSFGGSGTQWRREIETGSIYCSYEGVYFELRSGDTYQISKTKRTVQSDTGLNLITNSYQLDVNNASDVYVTTGPETEYFFAHSGALYYANFQEGTTEELAPNKPVYGKARKYIKNLQYTSP